MDKKIKSILTLLTATIIWGVAFVAQCEVDADSLGTFGFNACRYALGSVGMIPVIFAFEREKRDTAKFTRTLLYGAITGTVLFIASALQMYGIGINKSAGKSGFLTGLYIVIVPFLGSFVNKKRVAVTEWLAAAIATVGLFLLSVSDGFGSINIGDVAIFIGAFFWAVHILVIDRFVDRVSPVKYSCVQFIVCFLWNAAFAIFTETVTVSGVQAHLLPILYTGIFSTCVGYTCQILGQRGMNPNSAALLLSGECVWSAVSGAIILGETMSLRGYLGCILMFFGIILSQIKTKKE